MLGLEGYSDFGQIQEKIIIYKFFKNSEPAREPLRPFDFVQNRYSEMRRAMQRLASILKI